MATNNTFAICLTNLNSENPPILPQPLLQVFLKLYFSYIENCFFAKLCMLRTLKFIDFMNKMKMEFKEGFSLDKKIMAKNYFIRGIPVVQAIELIKMAHPSKSTPTTPTNRTPLQEAVIKKLKDELKIDDDTLFAWVEMQDFSTKKFKYYVETIELDFQDEKNVENLEDFIFSDLSEEEILKKFKPVQFDSSRIDSLRKKMAPEDKATKSLIGIKKID